MSVMVRRGGEAGLFRSRRVHSGLTSRVAVARLGAVAFAAALGLSLLGWHALNPREVDWVLTNPDRAQHNLSWFFLRSEPWTLPLTQTSRIFPPEGASTAFLDVIPLAAIPFKALDKWLPEPFQYYGWWGLLSLVLTAWAGFELCRLVTDRPACCMLGAWLMTLSPSLLNQFHGHFSLTAHWLILFSLWLYIAGVTLRRARRPVRWLLAQWVAVILAAATTPYLAVMVSVLAMALAVALALEKRVPLSVAAGFAVLSVLSMLAVFALVGFLPSGDLSFYSGGLYGKASLNFVGLLNPSHLGSIVLPRLPVAFPQQGRDAGYHYLGLGLLVLLAVALPQLFRRIRRWRWRTDLPLLAAALALTALAISPTVTFGSRVLFELPLPAPLLQVGSTLRASGRLFWPVGYLLVIASLWGSMKPFSARGATILLSVAVVLQVADLAGVRDSVHRELSRPRSGVLQEDAWRDVLESSRHLTVLPAWQCGSGTPGGQEGFQLFGWLAYREGLTLNSFYTPRLSPDQTRAFCHEEVARLLDNEGAPETAYVLSPELATAVALSLRSPLGCRHLDGYNLCSRRLDDGDWTPPISLVVVRSGKELGRVRLRQSLLYGWSEDGILRQDRALLAFAIEGGGSRAGKLRLQVRSHPALDALFVRFTAGTGAYRDLEEPGQGLVDLDLPFLADDHGRVLVDLEVKSKGDPDRPVGWPWSIAPRLELVSLQLVPVAQDAVVGSGGRSESHLP